MNFARFLLWLFYLLFFCALLHNVGCASLPAPARGAIMVTVTRMDLDKCQRAQRRYEIWGGVGAGASALSGLSGLAAALPPDGTPRLVLGLSALAVGALSAGAQFIRNAAAQELALSCEVKTPPPSSQPARPSPFDVNGPTVASHR
jgi:hypothetical protein